MPLVVVAGALANKPGNGGAAWTRLSWTLGFRQLGYAVFFVEQIAQSTCVDSAGVPTAFEDSVNAQFFRDVTGHFGLGDAAALIYDSGERVLGATYAELLDVARAADVLVNISGHLQVQPLFARFNRRVYVDLDPGFTQLWYADDPRTVNLDDHHAFFTVGQNIGTDGCSIPTHGIPWQPIRQPVLLDEWPICHSVAAVDRFTTVASWRGPFAPVEHQGTTLGLKVHEFRKFIDLPRIAPGAFELALDIHPSDGKDLALLRQHGWHIVDPKMVASSPDLFRRYVQTSAAECSVAQGVYVYTRSGWFSDRTARYLASGKPALVQDTGFAGQLAGGRGLIPFSTIDEAAAGAADILRNYARHARAARALAEQHFAAQKVLGDVLARSGLPE
jgi:hypothetical protein